MPTIVHDPVPDASRSDLAGTTSCGRPEISGDAFMEATACASELLQHYDGVAPTYWQVKSAIYSGRIHAVKLLNGRLALPRANRDAIAALFGMTPKDVKPGVAPHAAVAEHANA